MAEAEVTPCIVYGLWSERDRVIRYIGQTTSGIPSARLSTHRRDSRRGVMVPVSLWIATEMAAGYAVEMKILHWHGDAAVSEIEFIALYRAMGAPLLNMTRGTAASGVERIGVPVSAETRHKISAASKGRRHTQEAKRKMRAAWARRNVGVNRQADYFAGVAGFDVVHHSPPAALSCRRPPRTRAA